MSGGKLVARLGKAIATVIALVAVVLLAGQAGLLDPMLQPGPYTPVDFAALQRPASPNTFLVAPPGVTPAKSDGEAPVLGVKVEKLKAQWEKMIAAQPRVVKVGESSDGMQIDYIQRTRLIHYPDWITVRFIALPDDPDNGSYATIAIYSRSVYGYGDMGANRARVEAWLDALSRM
ncbi:MAG: DUF1499 domain-containing protein [Rhodospirillaceae bacterium]|nr:DUF1499 domain-containing protein [Rhodospirillaceae bacterium]